METFILIIKLMATLILFFVVFVIITRLLVKLLFVKVDSKEYEERLTRFLDRKALAQQRKLNKRYI
ncbi:MAG: hypothetical protein AAF843_00160 [Bacteroidota bacterium]